MSNGQSFSLCIPYVGAIIERKHKGTKELFIQTRWKPERDPVYSGTFEFPAGVMDQPFESVFDAIRREIKEETGLDLKAINNYSVTKEYSPQGDDLSFAFRPFCCTQQLRKGKPWIGFIFICEVEDGLPVSKPDEAKGGKWIKYLDMKKVFEDTPEKIFTLEIAAWEYYFKEN